MSQYPEDYPTAGTLRQEEPMTVVLEPKPDDSQGTTADNQATTTDVAKEQAAHLRDSAADAAANVADVAKEQAGNVAGEAKAQTKDLLDQGRKELVEQASAQAERVAGGLRSLEHELHSMAAASTEHGIGADLARQAGDAAGTAAHWMAGRDPGDLLEEVRSFARQRPATFLGIAAAAGVLAGRLGRGLKEGPTEPQTAAPTSHPESPLSEGSTSAMAPTAGSVGNPELEI
jgi:hypothetical protein